MLAWLLAIVHSSIHWSGLDMVAKESLHFSHPLTALFLSIYQLFSMYQAPKVSLAFSLYMSCKRGILSEYRSLMTLAYRGVVGIKLRTFPVAFLGLLVGLGGWST